MYPFLLALLLLSSLLSSAATADVIGIPVMVGGEKNLDACTGLGIVFGLNPQSDNFLAVRSGTNSRYALIDKLYEGQQVFICQTSADGKWLGVVYSHNKNADCGVNSPINPAQVYSGQCKSGWVYGRWIKIVAG
ncbi:MAG: hypothetical protein M0R47_12530 [Methylobacter sp.]|jgi:hypothetical protein|uniref:hypothetical protein n=1 Tax=Methylobacter sp. TaxID=2051955 RepID=UPI0025DC1DAF|nr:hypothetical protein [Methylobacter sp.]MCK9621349.1 hypothetical protein [Methylobacter sp.]